MANKTAYYGPPCPSGVSISRDDNKFTISWTKGKEVSYQSLNWRRCSLGKWNVWQPLDVDEDTTSFTFERAWSNYYPNGGPLEQYEFRVRGVAQSGLQFLPSAWISKAFVFDYPVAPVVTSELDNVNDNECEFSWTVQNDDSDNKPFYDVEWQTCLMSGYNEATIKGIENWSSLTGYQTGTGTATDSKTITELSANIASGSHTRWFRVRSRGCRGASAWSYAKHVYAKPPKAIITETMSTSASVGQVVNVKWSVDGNNAAFPIDAIQVRYAHEVPASGMVFPVAGSWTTATTSAGASKVGAATFEDNTNLAADEVLWIQVNTLHDHDPANTTFGQPFIVKYGTLATPESLTVSTNPQTYKAIVSCTNASTEPDSFLAVKYCPTSNPNGRVLGIIPHGTSPSQVTVQCPNWSDEDAIDFKVYAVVGSYSTTTTGGVTEYRIKARMTSEAISDGGSIPKAPANVSVTATDTPGTVQVRWDWTWADALAAEISWSDHEDAWESTEAPSTCIVTNLHTSQWNISGLETGKTWYVRVRLLDGYDDSSTFGAYCDTKSIDLSSAPRTPVLFLSAGVIPADGMTTATWAYTSTDGTAQTYAEICEATYVNGAITYGKKIAFTQTAQHIDIYAKAVGWTAGQTKYLCLRVQSASGKLSDSWSDPVPVKISERMTCTITATSLTNESIPSIDEYGQTVTRTVLSLTALPMTVTVSGAGSSGNVAVSIERASDYFLQRPDDSEFIGYKGETIVVKSRTGDGTVTINKEDLIGMLDDNASYRIVATTSDDLGQSASASLDFEVHWDHKAIVPTATIELLTEGAMKITPVAPTGTVAGDVCDIYRLSADKPQLILEGADWATAYVDPFPTIGVYGGYRVVFRTKYGDYVTSAPGSAWTDYTSPKYESAETLIDFGSDSVSLMLNMSVQAKWEKSFKETQYLGGAVKGDWSAAVSRTGGISAVTIRYLDEDTIKALHKLAEYSGICHVRMPDGSNFHADVQVSMTNDFGDSPRTAEFTLNITKVDSDVLDGLSFAEWST